MQHNKTEQLDGCLCLGTQTDVIIVSNKDWYGPAHTTDLGETLRTIGWDTSVHMTDNLDDGAGQFGSQVLSVFWTLWYWC